MNPQETDQNYDQPVAYDAQGRPLYAHPPKQPEAPAAPQPQVVHMIRPVEPVKAEVSPEARKRHERSKQLYPWLNLSEGEYVIMAVRRHPIGLFIPIAIGTLVIALIISVLVNYGELAESLTLTGILGSPALVVTAGLLLCVLIAFMMFVSYYVYVNNRFFLTNESVIQEIQSTLFARLEQTVSLASVEDASFTQEGIVQSMFNYGSVRLSTEGDETTYRFTYVANPKQHIATLNNAVEAFKNGRPTDAQPDF